MSTGEKNRPGKERINWEDDDRKEEDSGSRGGNAADVVRRIMNAEF